MDKKTETPGAWANLGTQPFSEQSNSGNTMKFVLFTILAVVAFALLVNYLGILRLATA